MLQSFYDADRCLIGKVTSTISAAYVPSCSGLLSAQLFPNAQEAELLWGKT